MIEMKNSGIGWVHDIPSHWNVKRGKYLFYNEKFIVGSKEDEYERLALTLKGVVKRSKDDNEGLQPEKFNTYQILKKDELVFKLIDLQNVSTSRVGLSPYNGIVSPAYIILKSKGDIYSAYAEKYYLMMWMYEVFNALGDSGVRSSLNATELLEISLPIPPFHEQVSIVKFLNNKLSHLQNIRYEIENQIKILEDYKKSLIYEVVTKGLNKSIKYVESGLNWIGLIPRHWKKEKIKFHFKRNEMKNPGDKQILSVYREYGVIPKDSRDDNHNVTSEDTSKYKYVKPGYLVINKMKAWQGSMGVSQYEGVVSPAYFIYEFLNNQLNKKYIHYLLRNCYKDEFRRLSGGIREGQWDLSPEGFMNTLIIIPPIEEQEEIADYLDKKCTEIDAIIADKRAQLKTLEEYKKSLIYEYVTGKKEVPNE